MSNLKSGWKEDSRPAHGLWAPGEYLGTCRRCGSKFVGDKRAVWCADCAYSEEGEKPSAPNFAAYSVGDRVRKKRGSSWQGRVVGFYSTSLTPIGYAVESEREPGSVQIYPESALERVEEQAS